MRTFSRKLRTAIALTATLWSTFGLSAHAQDAAPENALRIATGPATGVYTQLFKDMQKVCGQTVPLVPVPSKGGLDNLMLLSASSADLGFAQVDLMQQMGRDGDQNIKELQAVMAMHTNLLHVVTRSEGSRVGQLELRGQLIPKTGEFRVMRKFSEIKGATVALVGSSQLTGQSLERQLGYGMKFVQADSDAQALTMLNNNQVQVVFTTGGWPYPPIALMEAGSGYMVAEMDLAPQAPFVVVKRNYTKLGAYNQPFLGATNLLLTRPFKTTGTRGKMVAALQNCILTHMDELQEGPYHAAWKEIKNPLETMGVALITRPAKRVAERVSNTTQKGL